MVEQRRAKWVPIRVRIKLLEAASYTAGENVLSYPDGEHTFEAGSPDTVTNPNLIRHLIDTGRFCVDVLEYGWVRFLSSGKWVHEGGAPPDGDPVDPGGEDDQGDDDQGEDDDDQ